MTAYPTATRELLAREHNKAEFAAQYPDCWRAALTAMREIDRQAYALFALKWAHLIPAELLP